MIWVYGCGSLPFETYLSLWIPTVYLDPGNLIVNTFPFSKDKRAKGSRVLVRGLNICKLDISIWLFDIISTDEFTLFSVESYEHLEELSKSLLLKDRFSDVKLS